MAMRAKTDVVRAMLPRVEGSPAAMVALARQLLAEDRPLAIDLARRARLLGPDPETDMLAREVLSDGVPSWHFTIVRDRRRNHAYAAAIGEAVTPGCRVFEIGTGTGLLSLLAARAGAAVVTCEANPAMARVAREVIAANGHADRIRVVEKHSADVTLDDLGGPADLLISEIVSADLLSEGGLPAHADAVRRLLRPGAAVIPSRGRVRVALAELAGRGAEPVLEACGFDLSPLNSVARPYLKIPVDSDRIALRSDAADIGAFDFATAQVAPVGRETIRLQASGGPIHGVFQWIALDTASGCFYENAPHLGPSCWHGMFWPFAAPVDAPAGQDFHVSARHEPDRIWIWGEPAS